jgi:hypothetical protein
MVRVRARPSLTEMARPTSMAEHSSWVPMATNAMATTKTMAWPREQAPTHLDRSQ